MCVCKMEGIPVVTSSGGSQGALEPLSRYHHRVYLLGRLHEGAFLSHTDYVEGQTGLAAA